VYLYGKQDHKLKTSFFGLPIFPEIIWQGYKLKKPGYNWIASKEIIWQRQ
jgi:hypothetical protein